jgi:Phage terminase large subunit (GpA)
MGNPITSLPPSYLKSPPLSDFDPSAYGDEVQRVAGAVRHALSRNKPLTLTPLLPVLFRMQGKPYSINDRFMMEPLMRTSLPAKSLWKTGRQVSKTTSAAVRILTQAWSIPYHRQLYISPLFEMTRRFSQNYIRPFIESSPFREKLVGESSTSSVLQRSFTNNSSIIFSYAFLDAERVRGVSCDMVTYDEIQNLDFDFIPVIRETMSASNFACELYMGTAKTKTCAIEALWQNSSQAEWVIRCEACGKFNIPSLQYDLIKMIGPYREDISEERPAVICARCERPVYPRSGRWVHQYPDRRWAFAGYHMPQIIVPIHYATPRKWAELLAKQGGAGNTSNAKFLNEVCGETADEGTRLVSEADLIGAAALPWDNVLEAAIPHTEDYLLRIVAADWGGGGEDATSYTVFAVMGLAVDGRIDVLYALQSTTPHDHEREAKLGLSLMAKFDATLFVHDYSGAGSLRETFINQAGIPKESIVPIAYVRSSGMGKPIMYKRPTQMRPRPYYTVDKTRSLLLTCQAIKQKLIRFFRYDNAGADKPGLISHFMSLVDEKTSSSVGSDVYTISRDPHFPDDFAQAVNIGAIAIWHAKDAWPSFTNFERTLTPTQMHEYHPDFEAE